VNRRIGFFGGAFDPPHLGHLAVAEAAIEQAALDTLVIMPTGHPPHRPDPLRAAPEIRLEMCRAAFGSLKRADVIVSDLEIKKEGICYTVDSLRELKQGYGAADFAIILGYDAFLLIKDWKESDALFDIATIWVAERGEHPAVEGLTPEQWRRVYSLSMRKVDVSSSQIRERLRAQMPIAEFVPASVAEIIQERQLYR
jgi:nicotinate-nucleotide adenylyltransferase